MLGNINKDLEKIQLLFAAKPNFGNYSEEIGKWIEKNKTDFIDTEYLGKFDKFVQGLIPNPKDFEALLIRASLIGILIADNEKTPSKLELEINKLPETLKEAVKKYKLNAYEVETLKYTLSEGGVYISKVGDGIRARAKEVLLLQQSHRQFSTKEIRRALEKEFSDDEGVKTDWEKVSVYETNAAFNNAYLVRTGEGEWVVGVSRPDACDSCKEHIDGKIFKVIAPPGDYSHMNPASKEYKNLSYLYDNCLWPGKNNIGRKRTKRVKRDGDEFIRDHHELFVPALPMHPLCQCRTFRFIPQEHYLDAGGTLKFRVDNTKAWTKYHNEVYQPKDKRITEILG